MFVKASDIKKLETHYAKSGNQIVVLYGHKNSRKEDLIRSFIQGKKVFYYRCRQASADDQLRMMGEEISRQYDVRISKLEYDEYFNRVKSGSSDKLVVVIDEAQYVIKKDISFWNSMVKLKLKRLYPGPVMVVLTSSSIVWVEQELREMTPDIGRRIDEFIKIEDLNFLEVVRHFPSLPVSECVKVYGAIGGVPGFMEFWNPRTSFKDNICRLVLEQGGPLADAAEGIIAYELRELSVYSTILSAIAKGHNKLNDLFLDTGFSRAKISVYMKNLSHFDIIEKVVSFETGGWDNAKKGVYQIRNTYVNFWYKFVFPHLSDLYMLAPAEFYDRYIAKELDEYLNRYFRNVCMEYMVLLNQMGRLPFALHKMGTWVGKTGNIDIIVQSADRQNIVCLCNWEKPLLTMDMCEEMATSMEKAKIKSDCFYLFSAKAFEPALVEYSKRDDRFELVDMNEL